MIGRGYIMLTVGQGFGFGLVYHTCNMSVWLGPLVIDFTVPTPLWWAMVREENKPTP